MYMVIRFGLFDIQQPDTDPHPSSTLKPVNKLIEKCLIFVVCR